MDTTTAAVEIPANADHVFVSLSRLETVPAWAPEFVQAFEVQGPSEARARTPFGRVIFRLETDEDTRVIDMRVRPSEGPTALFPTRVLPVAEDATQEILVRVDPDDLLFAGAAAGPEPGALVAKTVEAVESLRREADVLKSNPTHASSRDFAAALGSLLDEDRYDALTAGEVDS